MAFPQRQTFVDRSNQAYRAGFQLGSVLLDTASHMFPKNGHAWLAGLKKALSDQFIENPRPYQHEQEHSPESPPPTPAPVPAGSLRDVNLSLKKHVQPEVSEQPS